MKMFFLAVASQAGLAEAALAGLASTEDFSSVALRNTSDTPISKLMGKLQPYRDLMLLQIKG